MAESQGGIAGDAASTVQDLGHAVGGYGKLSRQFRRAHFQRFQFLGQLFARMNRRYRHDCLLIMESLLSRKTFTLDQNDHAYLDDEARRHEASEYFERPKQGYPGKDDEHHDKKI